MGGGNPASVDPVDVADARAEPARSTRSVAEEDVTAEAEAAEAAEVVGRVGAAAGGEAFGGKRGAVFLGGESRPPKEEPQLVVAQGGAEVGV